jgi:hypothetical protein
MDQLWALKSNLEIPLARIAGVRADGAGMVAWRQDARNQYSGVITAGTFYQDGKRVFWDVHDAAKVIVIDLRDETYQQLIVEVVDSDATVQVIKDVLARADGLT